MAEKEELTVGQRLQQVMIGDLTERAEKAEAQYEENVHHLIDKTKEVARLRAALEEIKKSHVTRDYHGDKACCNPKVAKEIAGEALSDETKSASGFSICSAHQSRKPGCSACFPFASGSDVQQPDAAASNPRIWISSVEDIPNNCKVIGYGHVSETDDHEHDICADCLVILEGSGLSDSEQKRESE